MKKLILFLAIGIGVFCLALFIYLSRPRDFISPFISVSSRPTPLKKYYFTALAERKYEGSPIVLEKVIEKTPKYTSWLFSFKTDGKRVTGMADIPNDNKKHPVVVMMRGYADDEIYFTGLGTRKAAGVFAENGFITLAPDFLGFGGSDPVSADILEARFEKPIAVLDLLASTNSSTPSTSLGTSSLRMDSGHIFLWAHSNGGQIALSVLEISQRNYPTVLWAPVTKGFPESVLDYIGDPPAGGDDRGLKVKNRIDEFLRDYDASAVSIDSYWNDIKAPLQVHQGLADVLVKEEWTNNFVNKLLGLGKKVDYFKYPKGDHNLKIGWDLVVQRDIEFFRKFQ